MDTKNDPVPDFHINGDFKPLAWIGEMKAYTNQDGLTIHQVVGSDNGIIPRNAEWRAMVNIMLQTPQGNLPHQFMMTYAADDVTEAFAKFQSEAEKAVPIEIKRLEQQSIKQNLRMPIRPQDRLR